jgi:hypothetical protein
MRPNVKTILLATVLTIPLLAAPAMAASTKQIEGGSTYVLLDPAFVSALSSLGVSPSGIAPGFLYPRARLAGFPIPSGTIDLDSSKGDIFHTGGLTLTAGSTRVDLYNFVIDTAGIPVLTALAAVNGELAGRIPVFDLELTRAPELNEFGTLAISGVEVTLSETAATTLNSVFGTAALTGGIRIGEAYVKTDLRDLPKRFVQGWN